MKKISFAAVGVALLALSVSGASASERQHMRRHVQHTTNADPRNAFNYYPGWGRDAVPLYGVYPGLVYGGATSAPAGR